MSCETRYNVKWSQIAGTPVPAVVKWLGYEFDVVSVSEMKEVALLNQKFDTATMVVTIRKKGDAIFKDHLLGGNVFVAP